MMRMKISNNGISLIKQFEGCKLKAYRCPAGVPTIGYGHTKGVKMGQAITQEQAEEYLREDLEKYENNVMKYFNKYKWNQNEFDALVSFAYNLGSIDQLTAGGTRSRKEIAEKMLQYNKANGKELAGLVKRRKAEQELFLKPTASVATSQKAEEKKKEEIAPVQEYYPKYTGTGTLLVAHKVSGCRDTSRAFRRKIAVKNGIVKNESSYIGSASHNLKMLKLLKQGKLLKP